MSAFLAALEPLDVVRTGMDGEGIVGQTVETSLTETGGATDPASLVYYQVRAVNSCEWEGP